MKFVLGSVAVASLLAFSCNKAPSSEAKLVNDEIGSGKLKMVESTLGFDDVLDDALLKYTIYEDGTIQYGGAVSFFGDVETEVEYTNNSWYPQLFWTLQLGREFNKLRQVNFQKEIRIDGKYLLSETYSKNVGEAFTTKFGATVLILSHDAESNVAEIMVTPKPYVDSERTSTFDLSFSSANIRAKLSTENPVVKILSAEGSTVIQGKTIKAKLK